MSQELVAVCPCGKWQLVMPMPTTPTAHRALTLELADHASEHRVQGQPIPVPVVTVREGVLA